MSDDKFAPAAARLAHFSAQLLGWRPDEFWAATPAEMALAIVPPDDPDGAPNRAILDALISRFPDTEGQERNG